MKHSPTNQRSTASPEQKEHPVTFTVCTLSHSFEVRSESSNISDDLTLTCRYMPAGIRPLYGHMVARKCYRIIALFWLAR
jgi:hypothetical protein